MGGAMPQTIEIIDPTRRPGWDAWVLSTSNYSIFHSSDWAEVLHETYGYRPLYMALTKAETILAAIPCMEIRSLVTGRRGVSLPFTDYCEPIIGRGGSDDDVYLLFEQLIAYGKKVGWKSIELRSGASLSEQTKPSYTCYGHVLDLSINEEEMSSAFRDSTVRNIKKATKEGVTTEIKQSMEAVEEFYRLNCLTRKQHGLPPQPFRFFKKIFEHILSRDKGMIVLASYAHRCVAGALYLHFGEKALYKYGASDRQYQHLRANNLVLWEAIRWYARQGYRSLCFGRSEPENDGLLQFKRGWGATERAIHYHKYDIGKKVFVNGAVNHFTGSRKIFHYLPIPLLRMTGSMVYKHIG
jgi:lipid II:glycine glycyltransferase (peptidoglycan interpeptide bridge formation enzyme)